jgi:2-phospho-L-lactate guanylyltransferase (CobY/MobA/RfbA family)
MQTDICSVLICPSYKFDGTNLLVRNPVNIFENTRYDYGSFQGHLEASIKAGANTKVLLCTRLMIDLDTPEDLQLVLSGNISLNKSISYLRKIMKNHSDSSYASNTIATPGNLGKNNDTIDCASTYPREI